MSVSYGPYWDMRGLSSDEKPLDVPDGSKFTETDTGNEFLFEATTNTYYLQPKNGGGGGGVAGVSTFNNRSGAVMPLAGDYTADMVGADPAGSASTALTAANKYTDEALTNFTVTAAFTQAVEKAVEESITSADLSDIDSLFP